MAFFKAFLYTTVLSIAATAAADTSEPKCPTGWLPNTFHLTRCCPGGMVVDGSGPGGAYCCVNDMRSYKEALTNTALLYETATTTEDNDMSWTTESDVNKCVATVRFTASDYSAQVSSAVKKAEATPTSTSAMTTTDSGSQTSTPTSNAAMPLATAGDVAFGGAAFAAALFVL